MIYSKPVVFVETSQEMLLNDCTKAACEMLPYSNAVAFCMQWKTMKQRKCLFYVR